MADWSKAVLLIEYTDGSRNAYEFTDMTDARLTHSGIPGPATFWIVGNVRVIRESFGPALQPPREGLPDGPDLH